MHDGERRAKELVNGQAQTTMQESYHFDSLGCELRFWFPATLRGSWQIVRAEVEMRDRGRADFAQHFGEARIASIARRSQD